MGKAIFYSARKWQRVRKRSLPIQSQNIQRKKTRDSMRNQIGSKAGLVLGMALLCGVGMAGAHLIASSLTINNGAAVHVGDKVDVAFTIENKHGLIDIAVSTNGGTNWTDITTGFNNVAGANTFKWTVATAASTKAKIRLCQWDGAARGCTDADSVSHPTSVDSLHHYVLIGSVFSIAAATNVASQINSRAPFSMAFNSATGSLDVTFTNSKSEAVSLEAFDVKGQLVNTLVNSKYAAGNHQFSVASSKLNQGIALLKLRVGNDVKEMKVQISK